MKDYKLKIAQIAPLWHKIPPKEYGGTERVVSVLTEELVRRGHDVTLFATGDSETSAKLVSTYPKGLREAGIRNPAVVNDLILQHAGAAYKMQNQFDVIHDHLGGSSLSIANFIKTPVIVTLHGPVTPTKRKLYEMFDNPYYVSISKSQVKYFPNINLAGTVYNGLPMENYPFENKDKGYLLFVGRISKLKGVHYAIQVAEALDLPLIIAAKLDTRDLYYFKRYIKPKLTDKIQWVGEVGEKERNELMASALCLLNPITWKEPFGLTMIEAMACGSPVVAFNRGSIPEVIENGKTGFIVRDVGEMISAVKRIKEIQREDCREFSLNNFSAKVMADRYEEIYYSVFESKLSLKSVFFNRALGIN
ncbi:MAG TPA: glycosyltransferase family 4 protein [Patescibacteria group bacterium]|nr:glycosyltransferase family 4 protein [Patescibacteria group bacterium]